MGRLIDEDDAIRIVEFECGEWTGLAKEISKQLKQLLSTQPEQQWTPSGEKPPKEGSYLVWMPFAPPKHKIAIAEYCGGYWNIKTPISAWMPLPEPYKERRKE